MNQYIIYFQQLPTPVQFSTCIYMSSFIAYNAGGTWLDAKNKLTQYRNNKLTDSEKKNIKDDWTAVKYGANEKFWERFLNSIIWPVKLMSDIIPFLVLQMNPPYSPY